jgi:hypothetical protein
MTTHANTISSETPLDHLWTGLAAIDHLADVLFPTIIPWSRSELHIRVDLHHDLDAPPSSFHLTDLPQRVAYVGLTPSASSTQERGSSVLLSRGEIKAPANHR